MILEFVCSACEILFEEILTQRADIELYRDWHPCPQCGGKAEREYVSIMNFAFKAPSGQTQGSGVHGQSGVHDLDYPKLDKAIGRSAADKWQHYDKRKVDRDKVRKEAGTNMLSTTPDGKAVAADASTTSLRERALKTFSKRPDKKPIK